MRIIKIVKIRSQRRYVYDIADKELVKFGNEMVFREKLKYEDSDVLDWLQEETPTFEYEEFEESGDEIYDTEWIHEDEEI